MNWEMISAIGQMLGAIGVIISIVYLAAQIRNQNKESRRAAMNVLTSHRSDLNKTLVENPEMAVLFLRAMKSFDELDGASKLRVGAHLGRFLRFADSLYLGVLDGTLDRDYGADMSGHSPTPQRILAFKLGGLQESTGTLRILRAH
jgi:hypothetical protein